MARSNRRGYSLIEMLITVFLFIIIFSLLLSLLVYSQRSWSTGREKIQEQQEAQKAVDSIAFLLRQSSPMWVIASVEYPISIDPDGKSIIFYRPVFDNSGNITALRRVKFGPDPLNSRQLLRREGTDTPVPVAGDIEAINFQYANSEHTRVNISIQTKVKVGYTLNSQATLRNQNLTLVDVPVEEPQGQGEF